MKRVEICATYCLMVNLLIIGISGTSISWMLLYGNNYVYPLLIVINTSGLGLIAAALMFGNFKMTAYVIRHTPRSEDKNDRMVKRIRIWFRCLERKL